jgi:5-methylcytosine-specific restriction protein A
MIVLKRDNGICYLCGEPGADTVDHIVPNDDHGLTNLAAVHDRVPPHCHRSKSSTEGLNSQRDNRIKRRF